MSGFSFGTGNNTSNAPGSSVLFGANKTPTTSPGFNLGGGTSTQGSLFGAPSAQPSGLTFGSPATTMASGLSFGAAPNTGLSFGTPSFGAPAVSSATPTAGLFGAAPAGSTGLSFGSASAGQPSGQMGISFGQPAATTAQSGLSFGGATTGGLSFGSNATSTGQSGLSFGAPTASIAPTLGAPATSTPGGFSFGSNVQTTPAFGVTSTAPATSLSFGGPTATATATGLTFGTSTVSTGLSFGSTTASTSLGLTTPTTSATKPLTLSFGAPPATSLGLGSSLPSTTQSTGFNLGGSSAPTGLFGSTAKPLTLGQPPSSIATSINFVGTVALPSSTATGVPSLGLGGIDASQNKAGQTGATANKTDRAVKENQVPNEITQTIEGFKTFVKTQKGLSSDIARGSAKPLHKVQEDTESLRQMLTSIKSGLQRNKSLADRLKADTAKSIHDAEMAQRTHDTPPGLQYDNTAPLQYFSDLVANFENEMQTFRQEIENAEKHLQSLCEPIALTPQELSLAMRHLHDSFVALAGRLQTVHNSVEAQKEQYLNLRKYFLKDPTNVFEEAKKSHLNTMKPIVPTRVSLGPTPFSPMGNQHRFGLLSTAASESSTSFSAGKPLGWGGTQLQMPTTNVNNSFTVGLSPFASSLPVENQNFQLQKPPLGNKRGKR